MRNCTQVFLLCAALGLLSVTGAQAAKVAVPVKGVIDATGPVELIVTFYARAAAGRELYTTTQTFEVRNNIYFGMVDVPDTLFGNRQRAYFEVARPAAPAIALGQREQFTYRPGSTNRAITIFACSTCFTCGGHHPVFSGAWNTTVPPNTNEKGSGCSGAATQLFADSRPFLCCQ